MPSATPTVSPAMQVLIDKGLLDRLPVTFSAYCFEQMREWDLLFPAEKNYFERLFSLIDRSGPAEVNRLFAPMREVEARMGVNEKNWPRRRFTLEQVDFLNRNPYIAEWRKAVSDVFGKLDPALNDEVARRGHARLAIVIAPAELPVDAARMWTRIRKQGFAIPVKTPQDPDNYIPLLLTGQMRSQQAASIADEYAAAKSGTPYAAWMIESGSSFAAGHASTVRCSYAALDQYRKRLMNEVNRLVHDESIRGPRELAARLKQLKVEPSETALAGDPVLAEFARATLLAGNGTLLLNNTFVEWASIQAIRRARPSVHVAAFGIRNKIKPFSSLLIYADQEKVSPIPTQTDTLGSYVDLEIFYQYLWQEFEKYPEYRGNTAYVFAADGMDQMFVIAPADFPLKPSGEPVRLATVHGIMKEWLELV